MIHYEILSGPNMSMLQKTVEANCQQGFIPLSAPFVDGSMWFQAMVIEWEPEVEVDPTELEELIEKLPDGVKNDSE